MVKKIFRFLLIILVFLLVVIFYKTFTNKSIQLNVKHVELFDAGNSSIENFCEAVKIPTISYDNYENFDTIAFNSFLSFLATKYPFVDSLLNKEKVNDFSLFYEWKGTNPDLKPILLMAHMDVVPVEEETKGQWTHPPFDGIISDGHIWGRGTLDDKISVIGILEAAEKLLKENFKPEQTIFIAFGFDEEISGRKGALSIASIFEKRNIEFDFILDEGLAITNGMVPGVSKPVALIGVAEKGYTTLTLTANYEGGHSSMPGPQTSIDILSVAIQKLRKNPFPAKISEPVTGFIYAVGPEMSFFNKLVFSNMWLFEGIVKSTLEKSNSGNALIRTTIAPTILKSGIKENLIPVEAKATVNFRILPGETTRDVLNRVSEVINDNRITVSEPEWQYNPSPVSVINSGGYKIIEKTIRQVFNDVVVAPSLVLGATDSRHYSKVCKNIYRFLPIRMNAEDLKRVHGIDERISVENYNEAINFYYYLLKNIGANTSESVMAQ
jgi:carboxypeptidase PM20D1